MAECLRMGKFAEDWKKLPEPKIIFAVPMVLKIKPPNNIKNFRLLIPEYLWLWKPPFKMDIQRPILTAFCRQRIECALKRIGYQKYECKGPKLLIESINQIGKNFLTNQFQWGFFLKNLFKKKRYCSASKVALFRKDEWWMNRNIGKKYWSFI